MRPLQGWPAHTVWDTHLEILQVLKYSYYLIIDSLANQETAFVSYQSKAENTYDGVSVCAEGKVE